MFDHCMHILFQIKHSNSSCASECINTGKNSRGVNFKRKFQEKQIFKSKFFLIDPRCWRYSNSFYKLIA